MRGNKPLNNVNLLLENSLCKMQDSNLSAELNIYFVSGLLMLNCWNFIE
jgi:hypothetical protein